MARDFPTTLNTNDIHVFIIDETIFTNISVVDGTIIEPFLGGVANLAKSVAHKEYGRAWARAIWPPPSLARRFTMSTHYNANFFFATWADKQAGKEVRISKGWNGIDRKELLKEKS